MLQLILFAIVTVLLVVLSWRSLRNLRSHGFYRFFAWVAILALIILNAPVWFRDPFAWYQLISWFLLLISLLPLILGVQLLRTSGEPNREERPEPELLAFEKTTRLVTSGVYRYIRHPLYSSLLLLNWGVFFKDISLLGELLAIVATFFLILTAKADEAECVQAFGAEYQEYTKRTKMFIPYIY
jgi:protein-S-isoprenylcysteine O-methyltransferase Ste14